MGDFEVEFLSDFGVRDFRLFECPPEVILHATEGKGELSLLGGENGRECVLCTSDATYAVKKVETTNQVLVTLGSSAITACNFYYELARNKPAVDSDALSVLVASEFKGAAHEMTSPPPQSSLMTREQFQTLVMASDAELDCLCEDSGILCLKGFMRMVAPSAQLDVIEQLFDVMVRDPTKLCLCSKCFIFLL